MQAHHWEERYAQSPQLWSGEPNAALTHAVENLTPGRVLELGSGEGADASWLAERGWRVTGLEISPTAVARARRTCPQCSFEVADLEQWPVPADEFGLVYAAFLHARDPQAHLAALRRFSAAVAPGGYLLDLSHTGAPPGSGHARQPSWRATSTRFSTRWRL